MTISVYAIPERPANEAARMHAVRRSQVLALIQPSVFTPILYAVRRELEVGAAGITIIHEDSAHLIAASGFPAGVYGRSTSLCAHAILQDDDLMVVPDTRDDDRFAGNPHVEEANGIRFYAAVLLPGEDRLPLGTICVFDGKPRAGLTAEQEACPRRLSQAVVALLRRHT